MKQISEEKEKPHTSSFLLISVQKPAEPEFLNFEGAEESIPRNHFRQAV
jgi:hypothetical protein